MSEKLHEKLLDEYLEGMGISRADAAARIGMTGDEPHAPNVCDGMAGLTPDAALYAMDHEEEIEEFLEEDRADDEQRMMDVIEEVTRKMTGIKAVCTAGVIQALWNWETRGELEQAKACIEYLIRNGAYYG